MRAIVGLLRISSQKSQTCSFLVLRVPDFRFDHIRKSGKGLFCSYNAWSTF
jgi:hypothetical protein